MRKKTRAKKALISYCRVSTAEQGLSGLGLEAQQAAIRRYAELTGQVIRSEFVEVISSSKERPVFDAALAMAEQYDDILTVAKLDRLARDLHTITSLQKSKVEFVAVDMPGASKFIIQIMGAVAENERDTTQERTRAALARAKIRLATEGKRLGAPDPLKNVTSAIVRRSEAAEEFRAQLRPRIQQMRAARATLQEIADTFNREHVPTPSGAGKWTPTCVTRALKVPNGLKLRPGADVPAHNAGDVAGSVETANDDQLPLFSASAVN